MITQPFLASLLSWSNDWTLISCINACQQTAQFCFSTEMLFNATLLLDLAQLFQDGTNTLSTQLLVITRDSFCLIISDHLLQQWPFYPLLLYLPHQQHHCNGFLFLNAISELAFGVQYGILQPTLLLLKRLFILLLLFYDFNIEFQLSTQMIHRCRWLLPRENSGLKNVMDAEYTMTALITEGQMQLVI